MSSTADIVREQEEGLALLFQRGLELALRVQEDAMAAETAEERARLAGAFHRISRGVRQTAALRARLAGEARRAERDAAAEARAERGREVSRRRDQVKTTIERLIWTEHEDDEAEQLVDSLDLLLEEEVLSEDFTAVPAAAHIARICEDLGLPDPPLRGRWGEAPEGVEAHSARRPASQPPQSLRDSSPWGGASGHA